MKLQGIRETIDELASRYEICFSEDIAPILEVRYKVFNKNGLSNSYLLRRELRDGSNDERLTLFSHTKALESILRHIEDISKGDFSWNRHSVGFDFMRAFTSYTDDRSSSKSADKSLFDYEHAMRALLNPDKEPCNPNVKAFSNAIRPYREALDQAKDDSRYMSVAIPVDHLPSQASPEKVSDYLNWAHKVAINIANQSDSIVISKSPLMVGATRQELCNNPYEITFYNFKPDMAKFSSSVDAIMINKSSVKLKDGQNIGFVYDIGTGKTRSEARDNMKAHTEYKRTFGQKRAV